MKFQRKQNNDVLKILELIGIFEKKLNTVSFEAFKFKLAD